jgi:hypothetical protein
VATGLGFAILSRATFVMETRLGRLVQVPLSPPLNRHFSVVYPKERIHSRLVNAFVAFAKERMTAMQRGGDGLELVKDRIDRASRPAALGSALLASADSVP